MAVVALFLMIQDGAVTWIKDYDKALEAATRSRRPLLIYFCCD